jgi:hypothetical protein
MDSDLRLPAAMFFMGLIGGYSKMDEQSKELARQARNAYQRQYTKRFPEKKKAINASYWARVGKRQRENVDKNST